MARVTMKYGRACAFKPGNMLGQQQFRLKDKADSIKMADVIYKVQCKDCTGFYIGETSRPLDVRIKKHHGEADMVTKARAFTPSLQPIAWQHLHQYQGEGCTGKRLSAPSTCIRLYTRLGLTCTYSTVIIFFNAYNYPNIHNIKLVQTSLECWRDQLSNHVSHSVVHPVFNLLQSI